MADEMWVRGIERDMGTLFERQRALGEASGMLRVEVREGFDKHERLLSDGLRGVREDVGREMAHVRGEMDRLDKGVVDLKKMLSDARDLDLTRERNRQREEAERQEELIEHLRTTGKRSRQLNMYFIFAIVLAGVGAQQLFDHLPMILHLLGF